MAIQIEATSLVMIPLDKIVSKLPVRRLSSLGIKKLVESMKWAGFLESYPLIVVLLEDGTYLLIDGNHRFEAAKELGISLVPGVIKTNLSELDRYKLAIQANMATESATYQNLVTNAEFIWARLAEIDGRDADQPPEKQKKKYTQSQVGEMLGWGREKVANYAALQKICHEAWKIIVTTFEKSISPDENEVVTLIVTTFTETLLRSILDLTPDQQTELVTSLATNPNFSKGKFKTLAESYQARNEIKEYALKRLDGLGETYTTKLINAIDIGSYDSEWQADKEHKVHPKLDKLFR
jgi:ParB-like chromosome segregation protein Spo0J